MPSITHKTYIKADQEEIFQILTTSEGWNSWFTDNTSINLSSEGTGEIRLRWTEFGSNKENIEDGGRILEVISNKSFIFQWSPGEKETTVSFILEPYKEGTLIILEETGYSNSEKDLNACIGCAVGWGEAMMLLKIYIEHGIVYKQDL
jgi:uncharacterized protein YndB with AHSA1/START domain